MSLALLALLALSPQQGEHEHPHHPDRFTTDRDSPIELRLPLEDDAFSFVVFGDRTGGPAAGVQVLAEAVCGSASQTKRAVGVSFIIAVRRPLSQLISMRTSGLFCK